jgi:hypothetical protein
MRWYLMDENALCSWMLVVLSDLYGDHDDRIFAVLN